MKQQAAAHPLDVNHHSYPAGDPRDDRSLVEACLRGDPAAWNALVERYRLLVYTIALSYRLTEVDTQDAFQNVFVIIYRHLGNLRSLDSFRPWLIKITQRECLRIIKETPEQQELRPDGDGADPPAAELIQQWERQQLIREALAQLEPRCRELLTALFLAEGKPQSYQQIAERLGIALGSLGPTRARCFEKLKRILKDSGLEFE